MHYDAITCIQLIGACTSVLGRACSRSADYGAPFNVLGIPRAPTYVCTKLLPTHEAEWLSMAVSLQARSKGSGRVQCPSGARGESPLRCALAYGVGHSPPPHIRNACTVLSYTRHAYASPTGHSTHAALDNVATAREEHTLSCTVRQQQCTAHEVTSTCAERCTRCSHSKQVPSACACACRGFTKTRSGALTSCNRLFASSS